MTSLFVTGTDTEVGKTRMSVALMSLLQQQGKRVAGMKPIASGCELSDAGLRNEDALALMAQSDVVLPYDVVNPFAFEPAIAPHIAAGQSDKVIDLNHILEQYQLISSRADSVVVEGAGGWFVPLNEQATLADLAVKLALPVVLVVGVRLGCINHALLSVEAIKASGLPLYGWIANTVEPNSESDAIVSSLKTRIDAPCLGVVPHLAEGDAVEGLQLIV